MIQLFFCSSPRYNKITLPWPFYFGTGTIDAPSCGQNTYCFYFIFRDLKSQKLTKEFKCESYINTMAWLNFEKEQVIAGGKNGYLILVQM